MDLLSGYFPVFIYAVVTPLIPIILDRVEMNGRDPHVIRTSFLWAFYPTSYFFVTWLCWRIFDNDFEIDYPFSLWGSIAVKLSLVACGIGAALPLQSLFAPPPGDVGLYCVTIAAAALLLLQLGLSLHARALERGFRFTRPTWLWIAPAGASALVLLFTAILSLAAQPTLAAAYAPNLDTNAALKAMHIAILAHPFVQAVLIINFYIMVKHAVQGLAPQRPMFSPPEPPPPPA